ncbi:MAG: phasin family protein [Oceanidesulfovibrio sp.]
MQPKDLLYLGLGAAFMAKDRMEEIIKDIEEKSDISREEARQFVEDAKERAQKERKEWEKTVKDSVREVLDDMGVATKDDIKKLEKLLKSKAAS